MGKVLFQKKLEGFWSQNQLAPLDDLRECIELAEAWLETLSAYWSWFLGAPLLAFSDVTPQHLFRGKNGPKKLKAYLINLKNGGYASSIIPRCRRIHTGRPLHSELILKLLKK